MTPTEHFNMTPEEQAARIVSAKEESYIARADGREMELHTARDRIALAYAQMRLFTVGYESRNPGLGTLAGIERELSKVSQTIIDALAVLRVYLDGADS
jgi:hypothetical protein